MPLLCVPEGQIVHRSLSTETGPWERSQGVHMAEPRGAESPSLQATQCVVLLRVPAGQVVQLLLSSVRCPAERSQSLHTEEPYGAY